MPASHDHSDRLLAFYSSSTVSAMHQIKHVMNRVNMTPHSKALQQIQDILKRHEQGVTQYAQIVNDPHIEDLLNYEAEINVRTS